MNNLLASPTFCSWRKGTSLDVAEWVKPKISGSSSTPRTPAVIVSVAHLDEEERSLVLGVVLEEILSWVRALPGSDRLKALIVFDEVYGFLPPHPANPPTKRPIVSLMKQARAFGVGVVIATQNPMDLDYRALSNAGVWCIGRLQTDADRARVLDGLAGASPKEDESQADLGRTVQRLATRWFIIKNAHEAAVGPVLLRPRQTMSLMRGPMTRTEILKAREWRAQLEGIDLPLNSLARVGVLGVSSVPIDEFHFGINTGTPFSFLISNLSPSLQNPPMVLLPSVLLPTMRPDAIEVCVCDPTC